MDKSENYGGAALPAELTQARVVLTCGISGSGKTRLARILEQNGAVRISSDQLAWRRFGGDFSSQPREEQQRLFAEVREDIDKLLGSLLSEGRRVVVDATNCKRPRRDRLRQICRSHGVEPLLVYLPAPFETLRHRLASRAGDGPDDIVIPVADLQGFCAGFQPPAPDEPCLTI